MPNEQTAEITKVRDLPRGAGFGGSFASVTKREG